ncbi:MAG: ABC transporter permease [Gemmatimonadota bacterium]
MSRRRAHGRTWVLWVTPALAVGGALLVVAAALLVGGHDPLRSLGALAAGGFGTPERVLSITLVRATPLLLAGLAVALAFRGGVWNIGAEGQLYAGAVAAVALAAALPPLPGGLGVVLLLGGGVVAGAAWAALPAWLRFRSGTSEVITTLLMNFIALHLTSLLVRGALQESRGVFPQSESLPEALRLPALVPGSRLHVGFALGVALVILLGWALARTDWGFTVRATGASEAAARLSGRMDAKRGAARLLVLSGGLAGLAGAVEVTGVTYALYEDLSPGWGYTAIAVALLGGLRPGGVLLAAVFLGGLEGGASAMQRAAGVPAVWVQGIEATLILAVILAGGWTARAWRRSQAADSAAVVGEQGAEASA